MEKITITIKATIDASVDKVWKCFTTPDDILVWNTASADWHTTKAENDVQIGGKFSWRMEAKDGSFGFDFWGIYDEVIEQDRLISTLGDGRKWDVRFVSKGNITELGESFEAENENPIELQRGGWQSILDNFKKYVEQQN